MNRAQTMGQYHRFVQMTSYNSLLDKLNKLVEFIKFTPSLFMYETSSFAI